MKNIPIAEIVLAIAIVAGARLLGQAPPQTPPGPPATGAPAQAGRGRGGGGGGGAYPEHAQESPEVIARGKAVYGVQCNFCHGSDARGGEGGPNLLRSQLVLSDQKGETIAPVIQNGRPDQGMPRFNLTAAQISDVAAYIHSFRVGGRDASRDKPVSILVGDAKAGEDYFRSKCASCHSVTADLKGFGARFEDPKALQQTWLLPGGGRGGFGAAPVQLNVPPVTVTVTPPSGRKVEGRLGRIDDFIVTLTETDGTERTFRRDSDTPKVEIHDPLKPHRDLLSTYTDKDIHNLTAYLVTVK